MKRLFLLLALLLQFSLLFAQTTHFVNAKNLNVRDSPNATGEILTILHTSDSVEIISEAVDTWVQVRVNGIEGYASSTYLVGSLSAVTLNNNVNTTAQVAPASSVRKSKEATVYICDSNSAYAYHSSTSCRGLNRCSHGVLDISKSEAVNDYGRIACKICY